MKYPALVAGSKMNRTMRRAHTQRSCRVGADGAFWMTVCAPVWRGASADKIVKGLVDSARAARTADQMKSMQVRLEKSMACKELRDFEGMNKMFGFGSGCDRREHFSCPLSSV